MGSWQKGLAVGGLIAGLSTVLAGVTTFRSIERDVLGRTEQALRAEGRTWAHLAVDGRDLTLTGVAPEPDHRQLAAATADRVFGVRVVDDRSSVLPLAVPFALTIERDGKALRLHGAVPDEATRSALLGELARVAPGLAVEDRTAPARGAPAGFTEAARFAVRQIERLAEGSAAITGDAYRIAGRPTDFAAWQSLRAELAGTRPVALRTVAEELAVPAPPHWFTTLSVRDGAVAVAGFLPDAQTRDRLRTALGGAGLRLADDTALVAPGAPNGIDATLGALAPLLAGLAEGAVGIDAAGLTLDGRPRDRAAWETIESAVKSGALGAKVVADRLVEPAPDPYRLSITAHDGAVRVSGFVPTPAARSTLLEALRRAFGAVEDGLVVAPGAPKGWIDGIAALLPDLARFRDLDFSLAGSKADLKAAAPTMALGRRILDRLTSRLPGWVDVGTVELGELPPPEQIAAPECQEALATVQTSEQILFETGSARLDETGVRVLDRLLATALRCRDASVTAEGHTDSQGDPEANLALSEARARAVVDWLIAAGLDPARLAAAGWGETRPIADNATPEGRRLNRRIEFKVD